MIRILILAIFAALGVAAVRARDSVPASRDLHRWSITVPTPADTAVCENVVTQPSLTGRTVSDYKLTDDWKMSRRLKRAACITLGAGAFLAVAGTVGGILAFDGEGLATVGIWFCTWTAGGLSMLSSIPLFITSHHFKNRAKRSVDISLNATGFCEPTPQGRAMRRPALGVALTF